MFKNRIPIQVMMRNAISLDEYLKKYSKNDIQPIQEEPEDIINESEEVITEPEPVSSEEPVSSIKSDLNMDIDLNMNIDFNISFNHLNKFNDLSIDKKITDIYR